MHIHDFYSKLTSATEESRLFQALRALSQVDNPKSITEDPVVIQTEWAAWPSLEAGAANLAA
jgi:hypothetical protein